MMRYGTVCSGIEAPTVAWQPLGWELQWVSEVEKFPKAVLAHHYPNVPDLGDMTAVEWEKHRGSVELVCGGTPCQPFSVAGLRKGLDDPRGNLTLHFARLVEQVRPEWVVWENVPGVLSANRGKDFAAFLDAMAFVGYFGAYRVLDAQYFGVPQRCRRVFAVFHSGDWRRAAAVLFERESLRRNPPPSREAGEGIAADTAPSLTASGRGVERTGESRGQDPVVAVEAYGGGNTSGPLNVSAALTAHGRRQDFEVETFVAQPVAGTLGANHGNIKAEHAWTGQLVPQCVTGEVAHTLKAEGFDASEDGTGRGQPIVAAFAENSRNEVRLEGGDGSRTGALSTGGGKAGQGVPMVSIAFSSKDRGADACEDLSPTLRASGHSESHANAGAPPAVALQHTADILTSHWHKSNGASAGNNDGMINPVISNMAVRRLTPVECERLQGFPDNYTRIPWRNKPADERPDGPRYKALGNSMAVPVVRWLGERIEQVREVAA